MIRAVLVLSIILVVIGKLVETRHEKHIEIEVGQAYNQNIPLLFKRFQHSKLVEIKRDSAYYQPPICQIRTSVPGLLRQITLLRHNNTEKYYNREQIVFRFEQLRGLRVFIDAVQFGSKLFALYRFNEVVVYNLNAQNGFLDITKTIKIEGETIEEGSFIVCQNSTFLFTPKKAIKINIESQYEILQGYIPIQGSIDDVFSFGEEIYIAAGNIGIFIYKYDPSSKKLSLSSNATFYDKIGNFTITFDANRLHVDAAAGLVYILDKEQGVITATVDKIMKGGQVKAHEFRVLMGGCENMVVTSFSLYLTCPELVKLNRQTGSAEQVSKNSFYANEVKLSRERIFLFGHQEIAVYDILGNMAQEFTLWQVAEKSMLIGDYLVSFSDSSVTSSLLIAQQEKLHCYTAAEDKTGIYKGRFISEGLCSQYFASPQENSDICQVSYPFQLKLLNSSLADYKLELIVVVAWITLMALIGLVLAIRHHLVHKSYRQLVEEETRENIEIVPRVQMQKRKMEEMVE